MAKDWMLFEEFLWDSFRDGQSVRELRLSQEELAYLKARYPLSSCEPVGLEQNRKCWYLITLRQSGDINAPGA